MYRLDKNGDGQAPHSSPLGIGNLPLSRGASPTAIYYSLGKFSRKFQANLLILCQAAEELF
jgi:hypothetical protein